MMQFHQTVAVLCAVRVWELILSLDSEASLTVLTHSLQLSKPFQALTLRLLKKKIIKNGNSYTENVISLPPNKGDLLDDAKCHITAHHATEMKFVGNKS